MHVAKVKALSSKQRAHLSRARQAAKDMGFHLKSGAETAVAMRGEVADVMVRVARQLFENDGFNKLCRSLTKEFQKRSSKVIEADHVKLLHLVWFAQRLHRILESRDAQERKRRERAARNQVKKSAPSAKYTLDDDEEDNKSKPTAATRSETEQDLSPLPNPLDVAQVSSAVSAAVISWCCKSCQSYGFQKDRSTHDWKALTLAAMALKECLQTIQRMETSKKLRHPRESAEIVVSHF
eukprot:INCI5898.30.p2 GENE.INCI5898.30~~INCI5898.30.p2  ORF type:complete len:238 (+),score=39.61 INCI5898.30:1574-2287(+)